MKKILMILVIMFILPIMVVKADMGGPMIRPYDAYVVDVNGADYYEFLYVNNQWMYKKIGTLSFDTKITVRYETEIAGKIYADFSKDGKNYSILIDDIMSINDEFVIDENDNYVGKRDEYAEITILKENGIVMHKGPGSAYSKVGDVITKGTKVKYQYGAGDVWYYVEYNGVKGWICKLNGVVGIKEEENMLISKELEIKNEDKVVGKIPGNTIINSFYSVDPWSWKYYITYNGVSGYISKHDVSLLYNKFDVILKKDKVLYEVADEKSKVLVENIPLNTKLEYEYSLGHNITSWIYVTYNGKTGWVHDPYDEWSNNEIATLSDDVNNENDSNTNNDISNNVNENISNDEIIVENNSFTGQQIILLCVGAAIIISLTAGVTVILVNKKNNKKKKM